MIPSTPVVHHQIASADQSFDLYAKFACLMLTRSINAYQEPRWLVEAYQRRKAALTHADVIIASHQALFHGMPKEARNDLAVVVVDEGFWQIGARPNQISRLTSFTEEPRIHPVLSRVLCLDGRNAYKVARLARMICSS